MNMLTGVHDTEGELSPTFDHLNDPYVMQLIEALSVQQDTIEEQEEIIASRDGAEHFGKFGAVCLYAGQFDAGVCWLCQIKELKTQAAEMQLVAGRYQYLHEQAQKAINSIDDLFEYAFMRCTREELQEIIRGHLAVYTEAASKVKQA